MKTPVKDLMIEYIFATLGFVAGLCFSLFILSMTGLKGFSEALWFLIGLLVGTVCGLLVMTRSEANQNEARTAYHKAVDDGREREVTGVRAVLKLYYPLLDPLFAILGSLVVLIARFLLEDALPLSVAAVPVVAVLLLILRLPAMILARKKWAKEHIKK